MYKLVIEDDEGKTTVVPIIRDEISIGRKEGNTIRLTERNVSRRHARLIKNGGAIELEDVASRYGTRHNGEKISSRVLFREGDVVMIGDYRLSLQVDRSIKPPEPVAPPAGEKTATGVQAMSEPEEIPIGEAGKLVIVSSNYAGREFALTRSEMVIGRTEGDIRVDHRSISRNHAKIVRDGTRYKIVDLRSANGVRVNGEEYRSVHLRGGDVIELGHVKFRYCDPGEAFHFTPDMAIPDAVGAGSGGGSGKIILIGGVLFALLLILGGVGFLVVSSGGSGKDGGEGGKADAGVASAVDPGKNEPGDDGANSELLKEAEQKIDEEEWDQAITLLNLVLKKDPSNEVANARLSTAQKEKPFKAKYVDAKKELGKGRYQEAIDLFDEIPEGLSMYSGKIKNEGLKDQAVDGLIDGKLTSAKKHIRRKKYRPARADIDEILKHDPSNDEARNLLKQISKGSGDNNPVAVNKGNNNSKNNAGTKQAPSKVETPPKATNKKPNPTEGMSAAEIKERGKLLLADARKAHLQGNYSQAVKLATDALRYRGGLRAVYQLGLSYEKLGNKGQAIKYYNQWLKANPTAKTAQIVRNKILGMGGTPAN